jgi:AGCS family alanine or glycine:cation symporter
MLYQFANGFLFISCLIILLGSIYLSIKLRFVQLRLLPSLFATLLLSLAGKHKNKGSHTIAPHRALFTAMSTTLGISTIVGPAIAIRLGGPGALIGFLLTAFFGGAAVFTEVGLAMQHRKTLPDGKIMGGPMQYLSSLVSPRVAKWYALCCLLLMTVWSGAQANQLAAVLDSPFLGAYRISTFTSGIFIAIFALSILMGGIKMIGAISAKLVPILFVLYIGSCLWILAVNLGALGAVFQEIGKSFFSPYSIGTGSIVGGIVSSLRWGIFKGVQCCEAGIGTQTIPHSMAETTDPQGQAALAILGTYSAGLVAFLSGLVVLVTGHWQDPTLSLGVNIMIASFEHYFSTIGVAIIVTSTFLFGIGTILGNAYNGSECYNYLLDNKGQRYYLIAVAFVLFVSAIAEAKLVWSLIDIVLAAMALPHIATLIYAVRKNRILKEVYTDS